MLPIILRMVDYFFLMYMLMLFVRIMGSWFPEFQGSQWMRFIAFYTDPYLAVFRNLMPPLGVLDLSPMIAFFSLQLLEYGIKFLIVLLFS